MKCDTNQLERNVVLSSELGKATHLILVPHCPPLGPERARNMALVFGKVYEVTA